MYRETDDFGVDVRGESVVIIQKTPPEKAPGEVVISPKHLYLLKQWCEETNEEIKRRRPGK